MRVEGVSRVMISGSVKSCVPIKERESRRVSGTVTTTLLIAQGIT